MNILFTRVESNAATNPVPPYQDEPIKGEAHDGTLWVTLRDGRIIAMPLERYPLRAASGDTLPKAS